ncbi:MAG: signal peptidase I [Pseudobdellovibrionaceae bacterium]
MSRDLRATWPQALGTFLFPILLILSVRWFLVEPFVIPSGSMLPNLLILDHVIVNKLSYGIRIPGQQQFLIHWSQPQRGDIVVFRYPENPDVFYVKRLVGLPGDRVSLEKGQIIVNGQPLPQKQLGSQGEFQQFAEAEKGYTVQYLQHEQSFFDEVQVPEDRFFFMGDNRDQSSDSRVWGFVPQDHLVGRVVVIWLSCAKTLPGAEFICDPTTLRWDRFGVRLR